MDCRDPGPGFMDPRSSQLVAGEALTFGIQDQPMHASSFVPAQTEFQTMQVAIAIPVEDLAALWHMNRIAELENELTELKNERTEWKNAHEEALRRNDTLERALMNQTRLPTQLADPLVQSAEPTSSTSRQLLEVRILHPLELWQLAADARVWLSLPARTVDTKLICSNCAGTRAVALCASVSALPGAAPPGSELRPSNKAV
jgi:hypothetical protein